MEPINTASYHPLQKSPRSHTVLYIVAGVLILGIAAAVFFFARRSTVQQQTPEDRLRALEQSSQPVTSTPSERADQLKSLESKPAPASVDAQEQFRMLESN